MEEQASQWSEGKQVGTGEKSKYKQRTRENNRKGVWKRRSNWTVEVRS